MKKNLLLGIALCTVFAVQAQVELPYSKYLNFSKQEFKENHFKYDDDAMLGLCASRMV